MFVFFLNLSISAQKKNKQTLKDTPIASPKREVLDEVIHVTSFLCDKKEEEKDRKYYQSRTHIASSDWASAIACAHPDKLIFRAKHMCDLHRTHTQTR